MLKITGRVAHFILQSHAQRESGEIRCSKSLGVAHLNLQSHAQRESGEIKCSKSLRGLHISFFEVMRGAGKQKSGNFVHDFRLRVAAI